MFMCTQGLHCTEWIVLAKKALALIFSIAKKSIRKKWCVLFSFILYFTQDQMYFIKYIWSLIHSDSQK